MSRDSVATIVVPLVAIACCLAIPIVVAAGAGGVVLILGLSLPFAVAAVIIAWVVLRRHRAGRPRGR
ncbi:MAG: hypothetical protein WEG56_13855 [Chloroflexota bacterium]